MTTTPLAPALLQALQAGPVPAWALAEVLGVSVDRVLPILRHMRAQGLVVSAPDEQGVTCWRLA